MPKITTQTGHRPEQCAAEQAYDAHARAYDDLYRAPRHLAEDEEFFGNTPDGRRVIDVGCGTGLILDHLRIHPEDYIGVDVSQGMLEVAQDRYPAHTFVQADMRNMPVLPGAYDVLVSGFTAFNYVEDHDSVLHEFRRVLRRGGRVWMSALGPRCIERDTYALYVKDEVVPRYPVPADKLRRLFERWGFEDIQVRGMTITADKLVPSWAPRWAANAFVRLESRTLGRLLPSAGDFILLSARKA